jgi:hypothetical protein
MTGENSHQLSLLCLPMHSPPILLIFYYYINHIYLFMYNFVIIYPNSEDVLNKCLNILTFHFVIGPELQVIIIPIPGHLTCSQRENKEIALFSHIILAIDSYLA